MVFRPSTRERRIRTSLTATNLQHRSIMRLLAILVWRVEVEMLEGELMLTLTYETSAAAREGRSASWHLQHLDDSRAST